jgi:hypothetical protein
LMRDPLQGTRPWSTQGRSTAHGSVTVLRGVALLQRNSHRRAQYRERTGMARILREALQTFDQGNQRRSYALDNRWHFDGSVACRNGKLVHAGRVYSRPHRARRRRGGHQAHPGTQRCMRTQMQTGGGPQERLGPPACIILSMAAWPLTRGAGTRTPCCVRRRACTARCTWLRKTRSPSGTRLLPSFR